MADKVFSVDFDSDKFISGVDTALKELDKFEKGTAEFDAAMKKLQQTVNNVSFTKPISAINQLKTALTAGEFKLNLSNVNKSIDEVVKDLPTLTKLLDDLKKTLATTTDGTEFNELRQAIALVESGIVELGGSVANVGDNSFVSLRQRIRDGRLELERLEDAGLANTAMYQKLERELAQLTDQYEDNRAKIRALASDTFALDAGIQSIQGVTAAFQVYEGVLAAVGVENENLQEVQTKLIALLNVAQGLETIYNLTKKDSALRIAFETVAKTVNAAITRVLAKSTEEATAAQIALNASLAATPWGAVLAIVTAVAAAIYAFASSNDDVAESTEKVTKKIKEREDAERDANDEIERSIKVETSKAKALGKTQEQIDEIVKNGLKQNLAQAEATRKLNQAEIDALDKKRNTIVRKEKIIYDGRGQAYVQFVTEIQGLNAKELENYNKYVEARDGAQKRALNLQNQLQINEYDAIASNNAKIADANKKRTEDEKKNLQARIDNFNEFVQIIRDLYDNYNDIVTQSNIINYEELPDPLRTFLISTEKEINEVDKLYQDLNDTLIDLNNKAVDAANRGDLIEAQNLKDRITKLSGEFDDVLAKRRELFGKNLKKDTELVLQKREEFVNAITSVFEDLDISTTEEFLSLQADTFEKGLELINLQIKKANKAAKEEFDNRNKEIAQAVKDGILADEDSIKKVLSERESFEKIIQETQDAIIEKDKEIANERKLGTEQSYIDILEKEKQGLNDKVLLYKTNVLAINAQLKNLDDLNKKRQELILINNKEFEDKKLLITQKGIDDERKLRLKTLVDSFNLIKIQNETALINVDITLNEEKKKLKKNLEENLISRRKYIKDVAEAEKTARENRLKLQKAEIDVEITNLNKQLQQTTSILERANIEKEIAKLNKQKIELLSDDDKKKLQEDGDLLDKILSKLFGDDSDPERKKAKSELRKQVEAAISNTISLLREQAAAELRAADASVEAQRKRVDEALKIAEQGNAKYLKEEEDRLKELENKREAAARRQLQIDAALRTSAILLALAEGVSKGAQFAKDPATAAIGIATIVASIAAALAGGAALAQSLQGPTLYEGTDALGRKDMTGGSDRLNRGNYRPGRDTIPAMLDEGEAVISRRETDLYQPTIRAIRRGLIPHDVMNGFVKNFRNGINYDKIGNAVKVSTTNTDMAETNNRLKRLENVLGNIESSLGGLKYNIKMDSDGFAASIEQQMNKRNKINRA